VQIVAAAPQIFDHVRDVYDDVDLDAARLC
jgi:hypothetical protein